MIQSIEEDRKYNSIVNDILDNDDFKLLKDITHHGMNRFDHSVRVSYYSYKLAKFFKLSVEDVARGGLLHDFFLIKNEETTFKKRVNTMINHPKFALKMSSKYFSLNDKEKDIILSHMWPVAIRAPRYAESWLVDIIDNVASIYEKLFLFRAQLGAAFNILFFLSLNYLR